MSNHLQLVVASHKHVANHHHLQHTFQIGDHVWLLPCDKLNYQQLRPFMTSSQINEVTFRLELPF